MLSAYRECKAKYGTHYQINKALQAGELYKIEDGVYSDIPHVPQIEVISYKYPRGVFTLNSAFYYHGLSDVIPVKYFLATSKDAHKVNDPRIQQVFCRNEKFPVGITNMEYQGVNIRIYDRERMLIELIRYCNRLPFDYYKEIIESYRKITQDLDIEKLQDYIMQFSKKDHIMNAIRLEVL